MKFSLAVIALIGVNGVQIGHRHHHHHKHHHHHNNGSIPACNSATFPGCVTNAETAADGKLQADMDKHPKDYVVPNFGVDHDIISTQANIRKAGGKLHQVRSHHRSVPACNSHTHPACKDAITQAPEHLESLWRAGLAQAQSVPACNSHTRPGCVAGAKSAGLPDLAKAWKADDSERPDMNQGFNGGMHLGFNKADRNDVLNSQGIPMPVMRARSTSQSGPAVVQVPESVSLPEQAPVPESAPALESVPAPESEQAPAPVSAPALESVPAPEQAPASALESAPAPEQAPAAESAPAVESAPAAESAPAVSAPAVSAPAQVQQVQLFSDPICNSSGCSQYLHPVSVNAFPINYPVPNFGMDHDIDRTQTSYAAAEEQAGGLNFNPGNIEPEAYDAAFELVPVWERKG